MSKLLVVFGATGNQGGSVIDFVLNDPSLSKEYTVRAVTRDRFKPAAQELEKKKSVEVVVGDANDVTSLKRVLEGAHTVFSVTVSLYNGEHEQELTQGKAIADAAVQAGASYIIYSSIAHVTRISGGKYLKAKHFDVKAEVEDYIRVLPIESAFFVPGSFMQNCRGYMKPNCLDDGTYALTSNISPHAEMPLVNIAESGKYVGAILRNPDDFEGKILAAASDILTMEQIAQVMSKVSGKTVVYKQIPEAVFRLFLSPGRADYLVDIFLFFQDFGYYGPRTRELVEWTAAHVHGKLTTFEEYLIEHSLDLQ